MKFKYSLEQLDFLRKHYPVLTITKLTIKFNEQFSLSKTPSQIKATTTNHQIRCGRKAKPINEKPKLFNDAMVEYARTIFVQITRAELTKLLNEKFNSHFSENQVIAMCKRENLASGMDTRFVPGQKPWNTGTIGVMKPNSGNFKTGSIPPNCKPFGHERICKKDGYVHIKINEINPHTGFKGRYVHKHRYTWEQSHGPIPTGKIISFKDGNKLNCAIDNLELIDRATLAALNRDGVSNAPADLRPTLRTLAKLKAAIGQTNRSLQGEQQ